MVLFLVVTTTTTTTYLLQRLVLLLLVVVVVAVVVVGNASMKSWLKLVIDWRPVAVAVKNSHVDVIILKLECHAKAG